MNKQQAHELKLKIAIFAELTAILHWAQGAGQAELESALAQRDRARDDVYSYIDSLVCNSTE
jgi:hypothetical protein